MEDTSRQIQEVYWSEKQFHVQIHNRETAGHLRQRESLISSQGERQAMQGGKIIQFVADFSAAERKPHDKSMTKV